MIFEDDEKDNNNFDMPIDSDDNAEISWDDLADIDVGLASTEEINLSENEANQNNTQEDVTLNENNDYINVNTENFLNNEPIENSNTESIEFPSDSQNELEGITPDTESSDIIENDLDNFLNLDVSDNQSFDNFNIENANVEYQDSDILGDSISIDESVNEINAPEDYASDDSKQVFIDDSSSQYDISNITDESPTSNYDESEINEEDAQNVQEVPVVSTKQNKKIAILFGAIAAVVVVSFIVAFMVFGKTALSSNDEKDLTELTPLEESQDLNNSNPQGQSEDQLLQDMNNKQNAQLGGPQDQQKKNEEKVLVSVSKTGRANPFSPTGNMGMAGYTSPSLPNIAPPSELNEDKEIGKMVEIVCTGILYDNVKPSAIITVGGVDYFVQKGDRVDKFIVSAITPTSVVIRSGKNAYVASIGQQFDVNDSSSRMKYVYNGKSKPVTRQYLSPSPSDIEVKVK